MSALGIVLTKLTSTQVEKLIILFYLGIAITVCGFIGLLSLGQPSNPPLREWLIEEMDITSDQNSLQNFIFFGKICVWLKTLRRFRWLVHIFFHSRLFNELFPTSEWLLGIGIAVLGLGQQYVLVWAIQLESAARVAVVRQMQIVLAYSVQVTKRRRQLTEGWNISPGWCWHLTKRNVLSMIVCF